MTTTIATLMAKKAEMDAELRTHGTEAFKAELRSFFEANPECVGLRWRQYTPYFNDGEPCTFGVHEFYLKMSDSPADAGDYSDGFEDTYGYGDNKERKARDPFKATTDAVRQIARIDKDIFLVAFGDHVCVTATREGIEVEECSHE